MLLFYLIFITFMRTIRKPQHKSHINNMNFTYSSIIFQTHILVMERNSEVPLSKKPAFPIQNVEDCLLLTII